VDDLPGVPLIDDEGSFESHYSAPVQLGRNGRNRLLAAPNFGEKYPETREALLEIKAKQQKKNLSE
jgi:hypothetical protein